MTGKSETELLKSAPPDSVRIDLDALKLKRAELPEYQRFDHLQGLETWAGEASKIHGIPQPTITRWVRYGYIRKLGKKKNRVLIDAQDVAYCAYMHKQLGTAGRATFTGAGLPNIKE